MIVCSIGHARRGHTGILSRGQVKADSSQYLQAEKIQVNGMPSPAASIAVLASFALPPPIIFPTLIEEGQDQQGGQIEEKT